MANCEQYWDLISYSLDGALTQEEQRRLDQHLAQCPECRAMWEQLSGLEAELMELESPALDFADRVMAAAAETEQDIPFTNLPQNRKPGKEAQTQLNAWWKPVRNIVLVAACCLVVLGLGRFSAQFFRAGSAAPSTGNSTAAQDTAAAGSQESTAAAPEESGAATGSASDAQAAEDSANAGADGSLSQMESTGPLTLPEGSFVSAGKTAAELPQGFEAAGTLTEDQAGATGLSGCDYYTSPDQPGQCWVYAPEQGGYLLWTLEEN